MGDVRDRAALHDAVDQGVTEFGRMDIVVANASVIMFHETSLDITEDLYDLVVDTCLKGAWNTIQVTAPVPVLPLQALKVLPDLDTDPDSAFRAGPAAAGSRDLQHCCVPGLWRRPLQSGYPVSDVIAPSALPSRLLINGEWLQRSSGGEYAHVNPASGAERQTVWMAGGVLEFVSVKNVVIDLA